MKKRRASAHRRAQFNGLLEELEPRLLFNADAAALTGLDPLASGASGAMDAPQVQTHTPTAAAPTSTTASAEVSASTQVIAKPVELVFVDKSVKDAEELVASIVAQQDGSRTLEIHWLDSGQDGIDQISEVLRERQNVTALHLVTHGKEGVLQLGTTLLDASNLHSHAAELSEWGLSFSADADLMIYGCDVANTAQGRQFVTDIGLLTSTDVAASTDDTGAKALGGNWVLEYQAGQIQTASLIQQASANEWQGLLGLITTGGETIAHTASGTTESTVTNRQVASDSSGNFVIVYQDGTNLKAQRFNADGTMNGTALVITNTGTPTNAQVAMNANGAFVVVWNDASGNLRFRTYTNTGTAGAITTVATRASASEGYPFYSATVTTTHVNGTVGINAAGEFVIAWREHRDVAPDVPWYDASSEDTIKWKAYTAAGAAQGTNGSGDVSPVSDGHSAPSIGMNGAGAFVVSYSDSTGNIYARRYTAARAIASSAADITGNTGGTQSSAAMDSAGNYVIAYNDAGVIKFRMYNSAGTATTAVTTANSIAAGTPNSPSASMDANGNFTLVWQNSGQDGSGNGVYIRSFNGSGTALAADARVNTTTTNGQQAASVVVTDSKAVAVWSGNGTGDTAGVFFQRYELPNTAPTLTATASNPGFMEAAGSGTQAAAVNVFSGTAVSTVESGQMISSLTFTVSGIVNGASERIVVDGTTITLGADSSGTTTTNGMGYNVTVVGGTATVTLTKVAGISAAAMQTLVNGITYQNTNTDDPTAGNRVFTLTEVKDSGGTAGGGVDTRTLAIVSTVAVATRNDAPTLTNTSLNPTFTEAAGSGTQAAAVNVFSGTAVSTIEAGQTITSLTFTMSGIANGANERIMVDGTAITLAANSSGTTATNGMGYNVTIVGTTATVTLTKAAGITEAATQTLVDGITYQNTSTDSPTAGNRVFTLTQIKDSGGTANSGSDTTTLSRASTVSVVAVNDAPILSATAANPTFTEAVGVGSQAAAVNVFSGAAANTVDTGQTLTSLTFTISGIADSASERISVDGVTITLGANSSGTTSTNGMSYTVTVGGGSASITLTKAAGISAASMQTLVNGITYQNTSTDNPTSGGRVFTLTQVKDNGGITNGGSDTTALAVASTVTVAPLNDAPTLTATALNPSFTEAAGANTQAAAVSVFSGAAASTIEPGQTVTSLTFTISGIVNGASERIVVDGSTITLGANSSGTTTTNGMSYNVTIAGGTATVTLTNAAGISTAATQTLVNGITYQNTNRDDPTAGNRVFTLTQIVDSGGTANGGSDTSTLAIASTVSVVTRNDAPTLTTTARNPAFTEAAGVGTQASAVNVFSATAVSVVESGQTVTSLTFTISGIVNGASERIVVDGRAITLGANSSGTTVTNTMNYTVTVASGTATVTLTKVAGISAAATQTLVNGITYQNTNTDNPTSGNRVFTLTQIKDSGGTANSGSDTTTLTAASTVTVNAVNDAPTLTATVSNPTFTEQAGAGTQAAAVGVFSGAAVSTIETGQTITSLTFTIGGLLDGGNERIVVDGTAITLGANSSGTTATNAMSYSVNISGGTATVTLTKGAGISTANAQTLVNGITYQNTSTDNPSAGNRVFTLTQVKDSGGTANSGNDTATLVLASTVTVVAVNDPPVTSNDVATIEVTMAADVVVKGNDSDPDGSIANLTVTIVSFSAGITSATVNPDGTIHVQTGVTLGNETVVYYVTDGNGAQSANATLTVTVSASAPPSGTDAATTIVEDAGYTYGVSDFGFVPVNVAQTFDAIRIVNLPASGSLWLNGSPVLAGDVITAAQLGAGQLSFVPASDGNGTPYTAFTFQVRDNFGTYASSPNTFTVNITAVNDAPVLSGDNDFITITEDQTGNAGQLVSSLINSSDAESGAVNGIAIHGATSGHGTWQYSLDGGSNWTDLGSVSSNAALLLRASDYLRFVPDGDNADSASLSFHAWDETSGVAGGSADVTARGGTTAFSSAGGTSAISVSAVNDAPLLGTGIDFIAITEDQTANAGQLVSSLLTSSDIDAGALSGIAIDSLTSGQGSWEYSTDGGTSWSSIGSVSDSSALLLRATDRVRFVPDGRNADAAAIGFRAWDQSAGTAGSKVDASVNGDATAFSVDRASAAITITALNDAPVIVSANDFTSISEDDIHGAGQLVSTLLNGSDVDDDADAGIAVHAQATGNGSWQYSLDGGSNWADVSAVSNASALLLRATDRLRFVPDGHNADAPALSFYAWDQTSGVAGTQVDASVRGGTTAFSLTDSTSSLTVSAVNDAPILTGTNAFNGITEDATANAGQLVSSLINASDVDNGAGSGVAIYNQSPGNGTWQYSQDGGSTWLDIGSVSGSSALLLDAADRLRFVPDGHNADAASLSFYAWDQSAGSAGSTSDVSSRGGTTAFSIAGGTSAISVIAVNDAPVLGGANDFTAITENDTSHGGQTVSSLLTGSDVDTGTVLGIAIHAQTAGNGRWQYSLDNGGSWSDVGGVSSSAVRLLRGTDLMRFVPDGQNADAASISFYAWDQSTGSAGGLADATTRGGITAFSSADDTAAITVTAINDAPVLGGANDFTGITEDDVTNTGQQVSAIFNGTDVDTGALGGIAIHGQSDGNGTWQYSTDGGTSWSNVGTVSATSALLLRSTDHLRFVPDGLNADSASLSFHAWDQTTGAAGSKVDVGTRGGSTAFSSGSATSNITVAAVNDAPTLGGSRNFASIIEDEVSNAGTLVSTLLGTHFNDLDNGTQGGIAVTSVDNANGSWQFTTDGGSTWTDFGSVSQASARLLTNDGSTSVRFVPGTNWSGSSSITFRAWDRSSGSAGATADASTHGGTTGFSTANATSGIVIISANDAPVLTGSSDFAGITEDDIANNGQLVASLFTSTDVDSGAIGGIAIHSQSGTHGKWQYSMDGGNNWADVPTVSNTASLLLRATDRLRFLPDAVNGGSASLSFHAWDQITGTAGGMADVNLRGGTRAYSMASGNATINVASINDAPLLPAMTLNASASPNFSWSLASMLDQAVDVDGDTLSIQIVDGPTQGTLELQGDGGYRYVTRTGYVGADSFTYQAWDGNESSMVTRRVDIQASYPISMPNPPGAGSSDSGTIVDIRPDEPDTSVDSPPPNTSQPDRNDAGKPIDVTDPRDRDESEGDGGLSIPDLIDRIHGSAGAGQISRDLLFRSSYALLQPYLSLSGAMPTGNASIMQLLELIKPNLTLGSSDIDLRITPLNGMAHVLPADGGKGGTATGSGYEPIISLPKAASYSTGLGLSIGTVWWTARVSGLLTSALLSSPAWRSLDPLPVITSPHDDDDPEGHPRDGNQEDRDVEHLFDADSPMEEDLPVIQ